MKFGNWVYLFWTTLLWGAFSALAIGVVLQLSDQEFGFMGFTGISFNIVTMLMGGLMFSVISQMGFFSYMMLNYIAIGIFRKRQWWNIAQLLIMIVILFDAAYLRYLTFEQGESLLHYALLPVLLFLFSVSTAYWKVKMTNKSAFIPTLFFMTVATALEAVPSLQLDNVSSTLFMIIPLFVCNAWQILRLHKLVKQH